MANIMNKCSKVCFTISLDSDLLYSLPSPLLSFSRNLSCAQDHDPFYLFQCLFFIQTRGNTWILCHDRHVLDFILPSRNKLITFVF